MPINQLLKFKRELNKIAELAWEEEKTTNYILENIPIKPIQKGFNNKNVGLLYKIGKGNNSILLRADIDALKTKNGIKHICGHSTHMASLMQTLLTTNKLINKLDSKNKSIYFLFQPSEENFPSGAKAFIDENQNLIKKISYAFSIHVRPLMNLDTLGLRDGAIWARGDYFEIKIFGKMVHIKNAPSGIDALEISAKIILFIKALQSKYINKIRVNIGVINGGRQANTVADEALLKGDFRVYDEKFKIKIKLLLEKRLKEIEKETLGKIELSYFDGTPPVINNKQLTLKIMNYLNKNSNFKIISNIELKSFGCEDFAYITNNIPSLDCLIGTGDKYDIHEEICTISDKGTENAFKYFSKIVTWFIKN